MSSSRRTEEEALHAAIQHYLSHEGPMKALVEDLLENFKPGEILTRDEDVLDTWFSSALWPFSTLGWPDETPELKTYYPTDVLVTGFDIIFFWVARMMMMGLHFMDEEPFHTVYVHALVRDKNGAKMSKSKGNVIDPLELIDEYGADALRFTLAIMAAQGRDVKLDPARIAGYRNFGTKLWNATRFAEMNGVARNDDFWLHDAKLTINRWILTELTRRRARSPTASPRYRFNDAAGAAYRFVWNLFCDWYLELLKPVFMGNDEAAKAESQAVAAFVLDEIYKLLHPVHAVHDRGTVGTYGPAESERQTLLCHAAWPAPSFAGRRGRGRDQLADRPGVGHPLRSLGDERAAGRDRAACSWSAPTPRRAQRLTRHESAIKRLARVGDITACGCRSQRLGADRGRRGDRLPAAWQPDRSHGRSGPAAEGGRQGHRGDRPYPEEAVERKIRRQCPGRCRGSRTREARRISGSAGEIASCAFEGSRCRLRSGEVLSRLLVSEGETTLIQCAGTAFPYVSSVENAIFGRIVAIM